MRCLHLNAVGQLLHHSEERREETFRLGQGGRGKERRQAQAPCPAQECRSGGEKRPVSVVTGMGLGRAVKSSRPLALEDAENVDKEEGKGTQGRAWAVSQKQKRRLCASPSTRHLSGTRSCADACGFPLGQALAAER